MSYLCTLYLQYIMMPPAPFCDFCSVIFYTFLRFCAMQIYTFLRFPARILTKKHKILDYFKSILTSNEKGCHFLELNLVICRTFFNSLGNTLLHYATSIPFPANYDTPLPAFMPFETISPKYFRPAKQKNI